MLLFSSVKAGTYYVTHKGAKASAPDHRWGQHNDDVMASFYWGADSGKHKAHPTATLKMGQWDTGESCPLDGP